MSDCDCCKPEPPFPIVPPPSGDEGCVTLAAHENDMESLRGEIGAVAERVDGMSESVSSATQAAKEAKAATTLLGARVSALEAGSSGGGSSGGGSSGGGSSDLEYRASRIEEGLYKVDGDKTEDLVGLLMANVFDEDLETDGGHVRRAVDARFADSGNHATLNWSKYEPALQTLGYNGTCLELDGAGFPFVSAAGVVVDPYRLPSASAAASFAYVTSDPTGEYPLMKSAVRALRKGARTGDMKNPSTDSHTLFDEVENYVGLALAAQGDLSDYLKSSDAAETYLSKSDASASYLTATAADEKYALKSSGQGGLSDYLKSSDAAETYLSKSDASASYLTATAADEKYALKSASALTKDEANMLFMPIGYAPDLSGYLSKTDANATYAKTSDLSQYVKTSGLSGYVQTSTLSSYLLAYATKKDLDDYLSLKSTDESTDKRALAGWEVPDVEGTPLHGCGDVFGVFSARGGLYVAESAAAAKSTVTGSSISSPRGGFRVFASSYVNGVKSAVLQLTPSESNACAPAGRTLQDYIDLTPGETGSFGGPVQDAFLSLPGAITAFTSLESAASSAVRNIPTVVVGTKSVVTSGSEMEHCRFLRYTPADVVLGGRSVLSHIRTGGLRCPELSVNDGYDVVAKPGALCAGLVDDASGTVTILLPQTNSTSDYTVSLSSGDATRYSYDADPATFMLSFRSANTRNASLTSRTVKFELPSGEYDDVQVLFTNVPSGSLDSAGNLTVGVDGETVYTIIGYEVPRQGMPPCWIIDLSNFVGETKQSWLTS